MADIELTTITAADKLRLAQDRLSAAEQDYFRLELENVAGSQDLEPGFQQPRLDRLAETITRLRKIVADLETEAAGDAGETPS